MIEPVLVPISTSCRSGKFVTQKRTVRVQIVTHILKKSVPEYIFYIKRAYGDLTCALRSFDYC